MQVKVKDKTYELDDGEAALVEALKDLTNKIEKLRRRLI